jgi:hypothetical protein
MLCAELQSHHKMGNNEAAPAPAGASAAPIQRSTNQPCTTHPPAPDPIADEPEDDPEDASSTYESEKFVQQIDSQLSEFLPAILRDRAAVLASLGAPGANPLLTTSQMLHFSPSIMGAAAFMQSVGYNCISPERYGLAVPAVVRAVLRRGVLQRWFAVMPLVGQAASAAMVMALEACIKDPWPLITAAAASTSDGVGTPVTGVLMIGAGLASQV